MPAASLLFLGTGTSHGVPAIACECSVCRSCDPRNQRLRSSALIKAGDVRVLIDASVDLRQQALRHRLHRIDAILLTHAHSDHIFGLDEVRIFNYLQGAAIPCYGNAPCLARVRHVFDFIFQPPQPGGGVAAIQLEEIRGLTMVAGLPIQPIPLLHGPLPVLGYRLGGMAYCTDCSEIPADSYPLLAGLDVLVLDCLRLRPHETHMHLERSVETAHRIGARRTYFVHMCHDLDHEATNASLPPGMALAYDGLEVSWDQ